MKYAIIAVLVAILGYLIVSKANGQKTNNNIKQMENLILIDVRTQAEYDRGHIEGATLIPYDQIKDKIAEHVKDKNANIGLYCRSGRRSGIAKQVLDSLGYKNVNNLGSMEQAKTLLGK